MSAVARGRNGRVYVRRFDHEEAVRRHAAGESVGALATEYGVVYNAVWRVVTPGAKEREADYSRDWRTGVCENCGGPAMRLVGSKLKRNRDGRSLCSRCRHDVRRERLSFDATGALIAVRCSMLDCANGERWQPPENFPAGHRHREIRDGGIHSQCRACNTRARQQYREARKVPCVDCGALCLPPSEKLTSGAPFPRCRDCFVASRRKPSAVTLEAVSPLKEKAS